MGVAVKWAQEPVADYCRFAPVAVAWIRERASGPVRVITSGPGLSASTDKGQTVLTLPAGERGIGALPGRQGCRRMLRERTNSARWDWRGSALCAVS